MNHNGFMPHGYCFLWQPQLLGLHVVSDSLIALSYFSIPLMLQYFVRKRADVPFRWIFRMFGAFIVACGLTHVMAVLTVCTVSYWSDGALKALTASISLATAIVLFPAIPKALALRSPAELERLNADLQQALQQKGELLAAYERERSVATTLQRALLPQDLPMVAGLKLASSYLTAESESHIGGDWFDAFALSDQRLGFSCGDVAGHGLEAAALMGTARQMLRTAAQENDDPAVVLGRVNRALCAAENTTIVTAFYGVLELSSGRLCYALAGHPPPVVASNGALPAFLEGDGLALGVDPSSVFDTFESVLDEGALLVAYTDGLIEAERNVLKGLADLLEVVRTVAKADAENPAEAIQNVVLQHLHPRDDVAVLTVKVDALGLQPAELSRRTWYSDLGDESQGHALRNAVVRYLRERVSAESDLFGAEAILGELLGNVARHTPGWARVELEWRAGACVLTVEDRGPEIAVQRASQDVLRETGRGLEIVGMLGLDLTLERKAGGNRVSVTLPVRSN